MSLLDIILHPYFLRTFTDKLHPLASYINPFFFFFTIYIIATYFLSIKHTERNYSLNQYIHILTL